MAESSVRLVRFAGEGSGEAPLTWAQADLWRGFVASGETATIGAAHRMPAGTTIDEVAELLRFIMSRHQVLRTRLRMQADGRPLQVCSASGEARLLIVEAGQDEPADVAESLKRQLRAREFDYQNDWPISMAVVTAGGVLTHVVTVYLHMAVDAGGIRALIADAAGRDPVTGAAAGPVTAVQPLEQARRQATPAARRQSTASLRQLEQVLRVARPRLFGDPKVVGEATYRKIHFRSPASRLAAERIAAELNAPVSAALLAMFAVALARRLQDGSVWLMVLVNNRFRPGLADSVCQLVQSSPCRIDVAGVSLAAAVRRASSSLLHTYKNAYYDGYQQDEVLERVGRELGGKVEMSCFYNDRRGGRVSDHELPVTDDQLREAVTQASWVELFEPSVPPVTLFLDVDDPPGAYEFEASFDTRYLELEDVLALVRAVEAAAVETAITPDAPTAV